MRASCAKGLLMRATFVKGLPANEHFLRQRRERLASRMRAACQGSSYQSSPHQGTCFRWLRASSSGLQGTLTRPPCLKAGSCFRQELLFRVNAGSSDQTTFSRRRQVLPTRSTTNESNNEICDDLPCTMGISSPSVKQLLLFSFLCERTFV